MSKAKLKMLTTSYNRDIYFSRRVRIIETIIQYIEPIVERIFKLMLAKICDKRKFSLRRPRRRGFVT